MTALLALALHAALMLAAPPALDGLLRRAAARLAGRPGPPLAQPWRDLRRLLRKQPVLPDHASFVFAAAPGVSLAALLAAALLVPSFATGMATAPLADLLLLAGLFALPRAALALAGHDSGSAWGGVAADRSSLVRAAMEPALLLLVLVLALLGASTNLDVLCAASREGAPRWFLAPTLAAGGIVALAAAGRAPFGAQFPGAAALDYAGPHLAMLDYAAQVRLLVCLTLLANLLPPFGPAGEAGSPLTWAAGVALWAAKVGLLSLALLAVEALCARLRPAQAAELLGAAALLAALAAVAVLAGQGLA